MSQQNRAEQERGQLSMSALYRQLDDHLGPDEAAYDVENGLERLMGWMKEEMPAAESGGLVGRSEVEWMIQRELLERRLAAVERMSHRRMRSSLIATSAVVSSGLLAGLGLVLGIAHLSSVAVPIAATVGVIYAFMTLAVVLLHRATLRASGDELRLAFRSTAGPQGVDDQPTEAGPARVPERTKVRFETVPIRTRFSLYSITTLIVGGAAIAATWLPYDDRIWAAVAAGVGLFWLLVSFMAVVGMAIWSKSVDRRETAQRMLYVLLGGVPPRRPRPKLSSRQARR